MSGRDTDSIDINLLDNWQRDFPIVERPFDVVARREKLEPDDVIGRYRRMQQLGTLSRIGAVVRPNTVGASTLAAIAAPESDLERVAAIINETPGVNHNYRRENRFSLWFVVTGPDRKTVDRSIRSLRDRVPYPLIDLRLLKPYHLDLGFSLRSAPNQSPKSPNVPPVTRVPLGTGSHHRHTLAAIESGIELVETPFDRLAGRLDMPVGDVIGELSTLIEQGLISRFGAIVRHRHLGYTANAMAVWDVPTLAIDRVGQLLASHPRVTLCYQRNRDLPDWPFNLYCMIHARQRAEVPPIMDELNSLAGLADCQREILFSTHCFRQHGARFSAMREAAE